MPAKGKPKIKKKSPTKVISDTKKKVKPSKDTSVAKKKAKPIKKKAVAKKAVAKKTVAKKTVAKKTVAKKTVKSAKSGRSSKKKVNLLKLYSTMNKLIIDAVDKEIVKRFKILIDSSQDDITKASLHIILKDLMNVELSSFDESLQAYIKHYIFMVKRASK